MKKITEIVLLSGLILSVLISNLCSFVSDGRDLDRLRGKVLRLHILANSDSGYDQNLKLAVRDELLRSGILDGAENLSEAEKLAQERMPEITAVAEKTLRKKGCPYKVTAELADVDFGERVYGDITMPAGRYRALRIKIGKAQGHNWWCVMYPPLCLPAACDVEDNKEAEDEFFTEKECDIMYKPKKYEVRFALWDKIKSWLE